MDTNAIEKPDHGGKYTHWLDTSKQNGRNSPGGDDKSGKCQTATFAVRISLVESQKAVQQAQVTENVVAVEDWWQFETLQDKATPLALTCFWWS